MKCLTVFKKTSSSAMAERPRELDQRFQMGGQFEAVIVTDRLNYSDRRKSIKNINLHHHNLGC